MRVSLSLIFVIVFISFHSFGVQDSEEQRFLQTINDYRIASDLCWDGQQMVNWPSFSSQILSPSAALSLAARNHNSAMIDLNCIEHTCPGEPNLAVRAEMAGYPQHWDFLSENIAGGFETAAEVFEMWKNSTGHNRNMLSCRARAIGIARTTDLNTPFWWYWTTDFGDIVDELPASDPEPTLAQALDVNHNGVIDDDEIMKAISYWVMGTVVSDNTSIGDEEMLSLINLWVIGEML